MVRDEPGGCTRDAGCVASRFRQQCREAIVDPVLIIGAETVVGANLCVHWSEKFDVVGASDSRLNLHGCEIVHAAAGRRGLSSLIAERKPSTIVYCGPASISSWSSQFEPAIGEGLVSDAREVAAAAAKSGCRLAYISSDAVFSGPWMFHEEDSECLCTSHEAQALRDAESEVLRQHPRALVIRTNAYGWSPSGREGWLETVLATIEARRHSSLDSIRHATPILATDLAEILEQALAIQLQGCYHVAGAERISPLGFAQRLAGQFNLPWVPVARESALTQAPTGFGSGECSLQTKKIRRDLCVAMPLLCESLDRLESQQINGHRERIAPNGTVQLRAA
jgi:dTDP-4-dehydrorhamnose reductase